MSLLFRGRLSQVAIAILTAEVVLLTGCSNDSGNKSSFWRMPTEEKTAPQSDASNDPWAEDEEMLNEDNAQFNSYHSQSYQDYTQPATPEKNLEENSLKSADTPSFFSKGHAPEASSGMPTSGTAAGDWGAIAVFSEIADKNLRGSGTYGVYLTPTQRFKLSGEYLTQKLDFHLNSGSEKKWVSQVAFGAEYQYLLNDDFFKSIELGTAYSHAYKNHHNISGSNGSLSFLGTTARLWTCAFISVAAEYDWIEFDREHHHDSLSNGFGGSVDFVQRFGKDFSLNLGAQFRQPFNSYQGLLNWNHRFSGFNLDIGVFGNITEGHDGVRDIKTAGVQLGISFGPRPKSCGRSVEMSDTGRNCYARQYCDVSQWVATPAVYVPVVLAIADPAIPVPTIKCNGSPPTLTGAPFIGFFDTSPPLRTADASVAFSSALPLTYSLTIDPVPPLQPGASLVIDPVTGILTADNPIPGAGANYTIHITATNDCGSVTFDTTVNFGSS